MPFIFLSRVVRSGIGSTPAKGCRLRQTFPRAGIASGVPVSLLRSCTAGTSTPLASLRLPELPGIVDGVDTPDSSCMECLPVGLPEKRLLFRFDLANIVAQLNAFRAGQVHF